MMRRYAGAFWPSRCTPPGGRSGQEGMRAGLRPYRHSAGSIPEGLGAAEVMATDISLTHRLEANPHLRSGLSTQTRPPLARL